MTFLEICQRVYSLSGVHGYMTDVDGVIDLQNKVSQGVNESWIALQNLRSDWSFMIARQQGFSTVQGQEIYTPTEVGIDDLGVYIHEGIYLDNKPLLHINVDEYPRIDNTKEDKPEWYTVEPSSNNLYLDLPDGSYNLDIYYRRTVQDLFVQLENPEDPLNPPSINSNTPNFPESYHSILVYAGLAAFAQFIGNPEMYGKWNLEYEKGIGQLMREFLPHKNIRRRSFI